MDALAAAAIQRVLSFESNLYLKLEPVRLRTPEATLELPNVSRTPAEAKSHYDFLRCDRPGMVMRERIRLK
jgi:hypothetical protein